MPTGQYDPTAMAVFLKSQVTEAAVARVARLAMTSRQMQLTYYDSFYRAAQYDNRGVDWHGRRVPRIEERDGIMQQTAVPQGFYTASMANDAIPRQYRKPEIQHHLVRQVVRKFSSRLFSARTRPSLLVKDDPQTTEWLADMGKSCSLWYRFQIARNGMGAIGSSAMTFKFIEGRLVIEVHNTIHCIPTIANQATGDCAALEIRYLYEGEILDPFTGKTKKAWLWYRRVIDTQADTLFLPALVDLDKGTEPVWQPDPANTVVHGLGFFPGVWLKNSETTELDGDPDCKGIYGNIEAMDRLLTTGSVGAEASADPTLVLKTKDQTIETLRKGHKDAIRVEPDGSAEYMEASGSGGKMALEMFDKIDKISGDAVGFVRDPEREGGSMTAEEIRRRQGAEFEETELRREFLSATAIIPFAEKIVRAARNLEARSSVDPVTQQETRVTLDKPLPAAIESGDLASKRLDNAHVSIEVVWPPLAPQTHQDAQAATSAAAVARSAGFLDTESALRYAADALRIKDDEIDDVLARVRAERLAESEALESELLRGASPQGGKGDAPAAAAAPPQAAPVVDPTVDLDLDPTVIDGDATTATEAVVTEGVNAAASDTALNGAQVKALMDLASQVYTGLLPRDAAVGIAQIAFPFIAPAMIAKAIPFSNPEAANAAASAKAGAGAAPSPPPPQAAPAAPPPPESPPAADVPPAGEA